MVRQFGTMMRGNIDLSSLLWIVVVVIVTVLLTRRDLSMVISLTTTPCTLHMHKTSQFFISRRPDSSATSPSALFLNHNVFRERGAKDDDKFLSTISYEDTDGFTRGIVLGLTNLVNAACGKPNRTNERDEGTACTDETTVSTTTLQLPPTSTQELLERIQSDYTKRNYLWTGNLDLTCFTQTCTFSDPTLTFSGVDTFRTNTQNLMPFVDAFVEECESKLLSIELVEEHKQTNDVANSSSGGYVQTRWNMVGSLTASPWLFWKPKVDVIGRTKFWFRPTAAVREQSYSKQLYFYQVFFYDEEWEIPAHQALLQMVSPAGTFSNSNNVNNSDESVKPK
jgi:hypothetical protein